MVLKRFGWNNLVTILSFLVGIAGIVLFLASRQEPKLCYSVHPDRAVILDSTASSNLTVLYEDIPVTGDLSSALIAIWNMGNKAIERDSILNQITINTIPVVDILEAKILRHTRDVIKFSIDQSRKGEGMIDVNWRILEQNDGAVVQILYQGTPKVQVVVSGTVKGQSDICKIEKFKKFSKRDVIFRFVYISLILGFSLFWIFSLYRDRVRISLMWLFPFFLIIIMVYFTYQSFISYQISKSIPFQ